MRAVTHFGSRRRFIFGHLLVGIVGFSLGTYYQKNKKNNFSEDISHQLGWIIQQNPKEGLKIILAATSGSSVAEQQVRDAAIVRHHDHKLTMAGLEVQDCLSDAVREGKSREKVFVTVYPWTAAGSHVIPFFTEGDRTFTIAVHNNRRDREAKILRCVEGYMHPTPPKKSLKIGELSPLSPDYKDNAEEEVVSLSNKGQLSRESMQHAYEKQMQHQKHQGLLIHKPDITLHDNALRELREEVGIIAKPEDLTLCQLSSRAGFVPIIEATFYLKLEDRPVLIPDGVEIDQAFFIPLDEVKAEIDLDGSVRFRWQEYIFEQRSAKNFAAAVIKMRDDRLAKLSEEKFATQKSLLKQLEDIYGREELLQLTPLSPKSELIALGMKPEIAEVLWHLDARAESFYQKLLHLSKLEIPRKDSVGLKCN